MGIRIYFVFSIITFIFCSWTDPITIAKANSRISSQWAYVDTFSMTTHIVYTAKKEQDTVFYYTQLGPKGETKPPIQLTKLISDNEKGTIVSITGANDGRNIYVILNARRDIYLDLYITESNTNGELWSTPLIIRGRDLNDDVNRTTPSIIYLKSNRLFAFYNSQETLMYVTRPPYSMIWSIEKPINTEENLIGLRGIEGIVNYINKADTILYVACLSAEKVNPNRYSVLIYNSTDNGITWKVYSYSFSSSNSIQQATLSTSQITKSVYSSLIISLPNVINTYGQIYGVYGSFFPFISIPINKFDSQNMRTCTIKGNSTIIYFLTNFEKKPDIKDMLLAFPEKASWDFIRLPTPKMSSSDKFVTLHCYKDEFLAIGTDNLNTLLAQRFMFA